jgi:GNAT superfamily N-acetyltransferase
MIRDAVAGDFDAWLPLWRGYNAFYGRPDFSDAITRATWDRFLAPDEPMHALVAVDDGRLVGLAHYLFHRTTTAIANTCYLQDLFVDPAVRARGIGRALIEATHARAKAAGAARLYWQTHESNATAQRLYDRIAERSGFVVYRMPI